MHILCFGITPGDHEWLQAHAGDVEEVAEYLREQEIASALAHPFYAVEAPLTAAPPAAARRAVRRLGGPQRRPRARAQRARRRLRRHPRRHGDRRLRRPRRRRHRPHVDRGARGDDAERVPRPPPRRPRRRPRRAGLGRQVGARRDGDRRCARSAASEGAPPDPAVVLRMVERVMSRGRHPQRRAGRRHRPRRLPRPAARVARGDRPRPAARASCSRYLQADDFSHTELYRRARHFHERKLQAAVGRVLAIASEGAGGDWGAAATEVFEACVPAVPVRARDRVPGPEKRKLAGCDGDPPRVALVADGIGATHGVTRTLEELRERGVPGFEVEVIGTDGHVDRRLPSVTEAEVPSTPATSRSACPALPGGRRGARRGPLRPRAPVLARPGRHRRRAHRAPAGAADRSARTTPSSPPTRGRARATRRSSSRTQLALAAFYGSCDQVLSPSSSVDERLAGLGIATDRIARWDRGVDLARFTPARREPRPLRPGADQRPLRRPAHAREGRRPARRRVPGGATGCARAAPRDRGRRARGAGAARAARRRARRSSAGSRATSWPTAYASADLFLFCSQTDTYGQVVLEAQASGLPVVAVAAGGPAELVRHGRSGLLCPPDAGRARAHARRPGRLPLGAPAARPAAGCGRSRSAPGRPRSAAWRRAGGSPWRARPRDGRGRGAPRPPREERRDLASGRIASAARCRCKEPATAP